MTDLERFQTSLLRSLGPQSKPATESVTQLLLAWGLGESAARDQLVPLVYDELHRLAHRYMRKERPGLTLQTSALVNEAYLKLVDQKFVQWQNRAHFFGIAAQLMRRILVDYARRRGNQKHGGSLLRITLDEGAVVSDERAAEVVALHEALIGLAKVDPRKSQLVELRFFAGLSIKEAAEALDVSEGTAMRDWTLAKAWLRREMVDDELST